MWENPHLASRKLILDPMMIKQKKLIKTCPFEMTTKADFILLCQYSLSKVQHLNRKL